MSITHRVSPPSRLSDADGATDIGRLARLIEAYAPHDGCFDLAVAGAHAIRRSQKSEELSHSVQQSSLCIVAKGAKSVILGRETYEYDSSRMIVFSVDVPVASQVLRASRAEPFLCLRLDLDIKKVSELVLKVFPEGLPKDHVHSAVSVAKMDGRIVDAAARLMETLAQSGDAELIAPLIYDEIIIRLLRSPIGPGLAQVSMRDTSSYGVGRAVSWLHANFAKPMQVEELAALAHMSASAFHQHFKSTTSMSPLQYQKALRLQEARRLMLSRMLDAGSASQLVGYMSASQFSREYGRFFGAAPTKDIPRLRERMGMAPQE